MLSLCHPRRGLAQETALPRDSYLQPYYVDVYGQLRVGPPLLFVIRGLNMSRQAPDTDAVCSISGCTDNSFLNQARSCAAFCVLVLCDMFLLTKVPVWQALFLRLVACTSSCLSVVDLFCMPGSPSMHGSAWMPVKKLSCIVRRQKPCFHALRQALSGC
jgi:hypothetical protein